MSYFKVLGLDREPFSTSPDPAFFYESKNHKAALASLMIELSPLWMMIAISLSAGTGLLAGFYPAWRASKLDPIEALRYE